MYGASRPSRASDHLLFLNQAYACIYFSDSRAWGRVDVDLALMGIDKLLQELTFGSVGVAPLLVILYAIAGWARNIWRGGRAKGRHGGRPEDKPHLTQ